MASSSPVTVDDADSRILYSPGWEAFPTGGVVDGTKHGATEAGLTATFTFTGTHVAVFGPLGSIDVHGMPTTTYAIDGNVVGTYTAPIVKPGTFIANVTYFDYSMSAGQHVLEITNVNGTAPNVYWLDYIQFTPSDATPPTSQPPPSSAPPTSAPSSPPASSLSTSSPVHTSSSSSSDSSFTTSTAATTSEVPSSGLSTASPTLGSSIQTTPTQSSAVSQTAVADVATDSGSHTPIGPVVGGAVGGAVVLVLAVSLLVYFLRRRPKRESILYPPDVEPKPFGSWTPHPGPRPSSKRPLLAQGSPPASAGLTPTASLSASPLESVAPNSQYASDVPRTDYTSDDLASSSAYGGHVVGPEQSIDSGLRITGVGVLPPAYTRD